MVKIQGGLGNQMFGYAFARALSKHIGQECVLDSVQLQKGEGITRRTYTLDCFSATAGKASALQSWWYRSSSTHTSWTTITEHLGFRPVTFVQQIKPTDYIPLDPSWKNQNMYFDGLWQRPEYAATVEADLRKEFALRLPLSAPAARMAEKIGSHVSLAIQVRRGDYASHPKVQNVLWLTGKEYFQTALKEVCTKKPIEHVYVFSDDIAWCQEQVKTTLPTTYIDVTILAHESLRLISLCTHAIISNSSFGWWGAWLISNPDKMIIAPSKWFKEAESSRLITPPTWIRL